MERENKRELGGRFEEIAAEYLKAHGLKILEKNYQSRLGEIDLIAMDGPYLVFVEVKFRSSDRNGDPAEAVGYHKQRRIRAAARYYLYQGRYGEDIPCRFDVIAITGTHIRWIQDAFS